MAKEVNTALPACADWPVVRQRLTVLQELGLGYLTLGEETPGLSGGEAQRLKLASEMRRNQADTLFIFDEPTIGLHPLDVETLIDVLQNLIEHGATVVVIEHDLDMIATADYVIDQAANSAIVKDQLAHPDTNVFTDKPFGEEDDGEGFDMQSLFTIDGDAIQAAF